MRTRLAMGRGRVKGPGAGAQHGEAWHTGPSPIHTPLGGARTRQQHARHEHAMNQWWWDSCLSPSSPNPTQAPIRITCKQTGGGAPSGWGGKEAYVVSRTEDDSAS